ncbi:MAG TPA: ABC transporter substrate-binding protein [Longimicrobiales bacterium]|nr:ABC transporter substrate-binding protein [Longimicrobiales bacterium]
MSARRAVITLAAVLAAGCGDSGGTIHLGVAGPMQQANGRSMHNAALMAVEEINRAGINGRTLALVVKDDRGTGEGAIEAAMALRTDERVVAVVGHINSAATLAAAEIYNEPGEGLVELSPASSSPRISRAGPWTFRVCPTDLQHGGSLAEQAHGPLNVRRAAVLYENDAYGRGVLETFATAFAKLGGTVVTRDPLLSGLTSEQAELDVGPYLERAFLHGVDALVIGGQSGTGLGIIRAARRLGFDGPVLGADGLTGIRNAGPVAEGVFVSSAYLPDRPTEASRTFVQAYEERFGELPDHRAAMAYDAVHLLARVIGEAGTDREDIRDALAEVGRGKPAFEGVSGSIGFDANGDLQRTEVAVGVVRDGMLVSTGR